MTQNRSLSSIFSKALVLTVLSSALASAAVIYDVSGLSISSSSPLQAGRLSRNGVPTSWGAAAFPGVINTTVNYRYTTYLIPVSPFPYLQISIFDESGATNVFASAYMNAYTPTNVAPNFGLATNYLGDAGGSGNPAGNPTAFQVILPDPTVNRLLLVINDTSAAGAGVGQRYDLLIEGFYDTNFSETVPEPATMALSGTAFAALGAVALLKRKRTSQR